MITQRLQEGNQKRNESSLPQTIAVGQMRNCSSHLITSHISFYTQVLHELLINHMYPLNPVASIHSSTQPRSS